MLDHGCTYKLCILYYASAVQSDEVCFSVTDSYRYARVSGYSVGRVSAEADGITLSGDSLEFDAAYGCAEKGLPLFITSGAGKTAVTIQCSDGKLYMDGVSEAYTVDTIDLDGKLIESAEMFLKDLTE